MELQPLMARYQARFQARYAGRITPDQQRALNAILHCRTDHYGEILLQCPACQWPQTRYHSCGHRSCPSCQHHDTTRWLERQSQKLLPVEYFMVTFTLPSELRPMAWRRPKEIYALLFECALSTLQDFARNDRSLGGELGFTAVLHTHTRSLDYHPHLHVIVPGGCLHRRRRQWKKCKNKYLFNEMALGKVFRGRFLTALQKAGGSYPATTPKAWVVHCQHVGNGLPALQYLSRYLYRGVISEHNILSDNGSQVTFRYTDSRTGDTKVRTLAGEDFLWLLLQHTLPKGFRRVRDYGFLHGNAKKQLHLIQLRLHVVTPCPIGKARPPFKCCRCHQPVIIVGFRTPIGRSG